jgi:hypothetical protein
VLNFLLEELRVSNGGLQTSQVWCLTGQTDKLKEWTLVQAPLTKLPVWDASSLSRKPMCYEVHEITFSFSYKKFSSIKQQAKSSTGNIA